MAFEPQLGTASGPHASLESLSASEQSPSNIIPNDPSHEEHQYLELIRDILDHGEHRPDRTGTGTCSLFAPRPLRFSLSRPSTAAPGSYELVLPLLTTKRVAVKAVVAELLWFVRGATSSLDLSSQGVRIWDGNGSRAFLDSVGLGHRAEGDLGPVYGFQWRHFGAEYVDAASDYAGQGVDQLAEVVRKLKHAPFDRRIVLSAWNPADLKKMALPPCHMFAQFYVSYPSKIRGAGRRRGNGANRLGARGAATEEGDAGKANGHTASEGDHSGSHPSANGGAPTAEKGVLHTVLYQRSCDMGLGVPFNIASYAFLTHMLAHVCDLVPGSLTHSMGDAHVYLDHVEALETQLEREPREFPTLKIDKAGSKGQGTVEALDGWKVEDFVVEGYTPHKAIAMKMSV